MTLRSNLCHLELNSSHVDLYARSRRETPADDAFEQPGFGWKHYRRGDTVFAWKVRRDAPALPAPWAATRVERADSPDLFARMIEYGLRRFLRVRGFRRIARSNSESFVDPSRNLLSRILPRGADGRVGIFPEYQIQRAHADDVRNPCVAYITLSMKHRWDVAIPMSELASLGMDSTGLGVRLVDLEGLEDLQQWVDRAVGVVARVENGIAVLDDARAEELSEVPAAALHPEGSGRTMQRYLQALYPQGWQKYWQAAQDRAADASRPRSRLATTEALIEGMGRSRIPLAPGLSVHIRRLGPQEAFHRGTSKVDPTVYVFDYASKPTEKIAARGLREHGPYDKSRPPTRRPVVTVLCPAPYALRSQPFFQKLCDGCEYPDRRKSYLDHRGFARLLRLDAVDLSFVTFELPESANVGATYERALSQALARGQRGDLWFVVTEDAHRDLEPAQDPYCVTKAILFAHGVPVSNITIEEMSPKSPAALPFILANITLQAYAKMGGTPFVLQARPEEGVELILGVGLAEGPAQLARSRLVGFAAAFRTNGDYLVGGIGPPAERGDYVEELARLVEENLADAISREGAAPGARLRLVFHLYKRPGKDTELAAVRMALKKFEGYDVRCSFVQVNESHPWLVVEDGDSDGILARGLLIRIDQQTRLLNLIGPGEYLRRGYPAPLQLTVDEASTRAVLG